MLVQDRVDKLTEEQPNGCKLWVGYINRAGNGRPYMAVRGKERSAYRALWEETHGLIQDGMTIDHTCFNKLCLNLDHMELVTNKENHRRYMAKFYEENPSFPCGHPREDINTVIHKSGSYMNGTPKTKKKCVTCLKEYQRNYHKTYRKETQCHK